MSDTNISETWSLRCILPASALNFTPSNAKREKGRADTLITCHNCSWCGLTKGCAVGRFECKVHPSHRLRQRQLSCMEIHYRDIFEFFSFKIFTFLIEFTVPHIGSVSCMIHKFSPCGQMEISLVTIISFVLFFFIIT